MTVLTTENIALFLDFDGTLVDFAPAPDAVLVAPELPDTLQKLHSRLRGAFAIVSGRDFRSLSQVLDTSFCICACEHGADVVIPKALQLDAGTSVPNVARTGTTITQEQEKEVRDSVHRFSVLHNLRSETKKTSVTLHYREQPELQQTVEAFAQDKKSRFAALEILQGKCVVEFRFQQTHKGSAIETLMQASPFRGRQPVFLGDDVTDEFAFSVVNRLGGISIKVGEGDTQAMHRFSNVQHVHQCLTELAESGELRL